MNRDRARLNCNQNLVRRIIFVSIGLLALVFAIYLRGGMWKSAAATQKGDAPKDGVWHEIDEPAIPKPVERVIVPRLYRTFRLNRDQLTRLLTRAPKELTEAAKNDPLEITLPMPDGRLSRFHFSESSIMEPELAAKVPEIKTYSGQGIDDPTATTRFDWTPVGFHAIVLSASETVYIDPYGKQDTEHYLSYYKRDYRKDGEAFRCLTNGANRRSVEPPGKVEPSLMSGATLRTYRLAMAATVEYTDAFDQPGDSDLQKKARALTAMTVTLNRLNAVYERELCVRLVLITNEFNIIYTAEPDPYTDGNTATMNGENQTNLDNPSTIGGSSAYDIGHVLGGAGGGGNAFLGVVCVTGNKALGATSRNPPQGDPFDVDFVAHEIGHQFNAQHTFNDGIGGGCGIGQRAANAAYEPGSASTIMSYAGVCAPSDLQLNSNDYFHVRSLEEITTFIQDSGGSCSVLSSTGNDPPTVSAGPDFIIPRNTPFTLTATGSDPNGNTLTYCWEEYDEPEAASPPDSDADGIKRPIFRSYMGQTSPSRTFPSLQYILNNANQPPTTYVCGTDSMGNPINCATGESLPSITRTMFFQVTARDNHVGGGGLSTDIARINVNANAGPFVVTEPNAAVSWNIASSQTVTWNVADTNTPPVSCASVNILLSTDGGNSFPVVLASGTANDGAEAVTLPITLTTQGRIKVQAADNIFFDISDANFTIKASVTNANDSGSGSLRALLAIASLAPTPPIIISFDIPGMGLHTINLTSPAQEITVPVVIDGTTQPGYTGNPLIELNGTGAGSGANGLLISAGNSIVKGLIINRFDGVGILITGNGGNAVEENFIGTNSGGNVDLGNKLGGVLISGSPGNTIGGPSLASRNVISGNGNESFLANGIAIVGAGATGNVIEGNFIGTNVGGGAPLGNSGDGVRTSAPSNIIRGNRAISGNGSSGIEIADDASDTLVHGNKIGTDSTGEVALGNSSDGILILTPDNQIGSTELGAGLNIISSNGGSGIRISGTSAGSNRVQHNRIGISSSNAPLGNAESGINIENAAGTIVGGASPRSDNVIAGNSQHGILISGFSATNNIVLGNFIGTNGNVPLGNQMNGVLIQNSATNNTIGGGLAFNLISANGGNGVELKVGGNFVQGNFIGTDSTGWHDMGNALSGVRIDTAGSSFVAKIGGASPALRNVISGNDLHGIEIRGGSGGPIGHIVEGNFIGIRFDGASPLSNTSHGVYITLFANNNRIGGTDAGAGNTIAFNGGAGIYIEGTIFNSGTRNVIRSNSIFSNTGLGIDLGFIGVTPNDPGDGDLGGNNLQNYPVLTSATPLAASINIQGSLGTTSNGNFTIEFFSTPVPDASGNGEGRIPLGSTIIMTDPSGNATIDATLSTSVPPGQYVTATATDSQGNTSEFSQEVQVPGGCGSISPISRTFPVVGGSGTIDLAMFSPCEWTAVSNDSWIVLVSKASGSGSDNISYEVRENYSFFARIGTITISGQTFTVNQLSSCTTSITPTLQSFLKSGGTGNVNVTAESLCGWTAISNTSWITITSGGSGMGNGVVTYSVATNSGPGRAGTMTIGGKTFTVKQKAP